MTDPYANIRRALAKFETRNDPPRTQQPAAMDKAVECPECGRKWPWESEQAVAVGLQGACIACTSRYPDGAHEESQRRYSLGAALRERLGEGEQQ